MFRATMNTLARSTFSVFIKENAPAVSDAGRKHVFRTLSKQYKALTPAQKKAYVQRAKRLPQSKNYKLFQAFDKKHRKAVSHLSLRNQNKEIGRLWQQRKAAIAAKNKKNKTKKASKVAKKTKKIRKTKKSSVKKVAAVKKQQKKQKKVAAAAVAAKKN